MLRRLDDYLVAGFTARAFFLHLTVIVVALAVMAHWIVDVIIGTPLLLGSEEWLSLEPPRCARDYNDNIGGISAEGYLCPDPIDAVYTWVNGSEPEHERELRFWRVREAAQVDELDVNETSISHDATQTPFDQHDLGGPSRFQDHGELLFSLRSLERFAPWVRYVYIVTNGQIPTWLDTTNPRIRVVSHSQIFKNKSHLPTFSSPAIEAHLHRIPGLSKRFLYLNDDTFFGSPVLPDDFLSPTRGHRIFLSWPVPNCANGCPSSWLKDGFCDRACNTTECDYDGGDCLVPDTRTAKRENNPMYQSMSQKNTFSASRLCHIGCADEWLGDNRCDPACDTAACGFDGGDCGDVKSLQRLPSMNTTCGRTGTNFDAPYDSQAFILNLDRSLPMLRRITIVSGDASEGCWLRSATIIQAHRLMVLTVLSVEIIESEDRIHLADVCTFRVRGDASGESGGFSVDVRFNITRHRRRAERGAVSNVSSLLHNPTPPMNEERNLESIIARYVDRTNRRYPSPSTAVSDESRGGSGGRQLLGLSTIELQQRDAAVLAAEDKAIRQMNQELWEAADWRRALIDSIRIGDDEGHASTKRRLLDMFGDSLKFGNKLLSSRFGNAARKVPSHMVHMIDRNVIDQLWEMWPAELDATSASKFRSDTNIQYGFFHFYYIMHSMKKWTCDAFFDEIVDVNQNGIVDEAEIRRMALLAFDRNFRERTLQHLLNEMRANASKLLNETIEEDENKTTQQPEGSPLPPTPSPPPPTQVAQATEAPRPHRRNIFIRTNHTLNATRAQPAQRVPPSPPDLAHTVQNAIPASPYLSPNPEERIEPLSESMVDLVRTLVHDGAYGIERRALHFQATGEKLLSPTPTPMTRALFCGTSIATFLMKQVVLRNAYDFTLESEDDITFFMIRDNKTVTQHQMDHILQKRSKFVCINDNMNHSHPDHQEVVRIVRSLLETYFPRPSRFERINGERNPFTRLDDERLMLLYGPWREATDGPPLVQPLGRVGYVVKDVGGGGWWSSALVTTVFYVVLFTVVRTCLALRRQAQKASRRRRH